MLLLLVRQCVIRALLDISATEGLPQAPHSFQMLIMANLARLDTTVRLGALLQSLALLGRTMTKRRVPIYWKPASHVTLTHTQIALDKQGVSPVVQHRQLVQDKPLAPVWGSTDGSNPAKVLAFAKADTKATTSQELPSLILTLL